ncbi:MAG: DsrE family protein [gamma proteobacterium endosymbiont of Lamellibrachia anaximandri]|nr:DsrE family protein [gamma proteobacterium endosymbiont of Lamellibrachia anaximandri]
MEGHRGALILLLAAALLFCSVLQASEVNRLLRSETAPDGVVFEILESDVDDLGWAIPQTLRHIKALRARFPGLDIAIVTHGPEMFALKSSDRDAFPEAHEIVQSLTQDQGVDVHVCGTHASWYGDTDEDFPDYVDVAPSGPSQISQYLELGYKLIVIEREW